jgi:hypothetical protein
MCYWRLYNTKNTTYRRPATDDAKLFPQQARKNCRCRIRATYINNFLLQAADSFVPAFIILVCTCWQEGLLDGAPTGCKAFVNTMEKWTGKAFLQWLHCFVEKVHWTATRKFYLFCSFTNLTSALRHEIVLQKTKRPSSHFSLVWRKILIN